MATRRGLLGGAAALALGHIPPARAADRLTVTGHAVHRTAATTGPGGNVLQAWSERTGKVVEWLTFGVEAANERAFQEASLSRGNVDLMFVLDRYVGPQYANLFEDVAVWQARDPIPQLDEIPPGMLAAHTFGSKLTAVPFRHATHGMHYNTALMAERGVTEPPKTMQEAIALAEKLTYTRTDGTKVYGLVINLDDPATVIDWVRGYGGDFITPDYKVVIDQPQAVQGIAALCALYRKGAMPRNVMNLKTEDLITFMQQGRAVMTNNPFNRTFNYNDAKASKFAGKITVAPLPLAADGKPTPAKTSVWAMAIPANAPDKAASWQLVKHLSLPESTVREALNGNGPVRPSAYEDKRVQAVLPYAEAEETALKTARLVIPGFANAAKAMDMFIEELGLALLGSKEPQAAMSSLKTRVQPLLPT